MVEELIKSMRRSNPDATEVAASLDVLRTMTTQIDEARVDMRSAVEAVCESFGNMAQKAMQTVNIASDTAGIGGTDGDSNLISNVRLTLEDMLDTLRASSRNSAEMAAQINLMDENLKSIHGCLREIEHIAKDAKLVALNGTIEAARVNEAGAAFRVVAEETKNLAFHAGSTSEHIRETVLELTESLTGAAEHLTSRAELDAEVTTRSEQAAMGSLTLLSQMHEQLTQGMRETEQLSQSLNQDISRSVMAMQFQDRVSQRLEHVMETISEVCDSVCPDERFVSESRRQEIVNEWAALLSRKYTMAAERNVHTADVSESSDGGDFELF